MLRQAGTTTILVTHDQDEALSMADQVAVLRHGVIAQLDSPAGIYQPPARPRPGAVPRGVQRAARHRWRPPPRGRAGSMAADTPLGVLAGRGLARPRRRAAVAHVMIRPEQLVIGEVAAAPVSGDRRELPVLRPRCRGPGPARGRPAARAGGPGHRGHAARSGSRVGLSVQGPVVAWPIDEQARTTPGSPTSTDPGAEARRPVGPSTGRRQPSQPAPEGQGAATLPEPRKHASVTTALSSALQ